MLSFGKKKKHSSEVHYFKTLKGMIGMIRDPERTESVFDIEDGLKNIEATKVYLAKVKEDPGVCALMEARHLSAVPDMDTLAAMPEGTLGKRFAHHILDQGFDPDYYRKINVKSDLDWVMFRMRQNHDLWHVVTGIGTCAIGELALKAFELAQTRRPMAAVITSGGVFRYLLKSPDEFGDVLEAISYGYQLGKQAKPFLARKWEEGWRRPLADWRAEVGIDTDIDAKTPAAVKRAAADDAEREAEPPAQQEGVAGA
ncbi:MAG: Coq4 family protein [Planctomycetota bacterium]|jgi:ubiquinone biosynthesis protein Coq4